MHDYNKPVANPLVVLREEFDDWAILFDPDTGDALGINPMGVFVWKRLDSYHAIQDIQNEVRDLYDNVPNEANDQIKEFIQELIKKKFVSYEIQET
ncbi:MAG: SynChlorMet cassette protein ScmD [Deltaproteobacteria bacterium]|nr:SynChlorMet cassette protein ScmD [Deltaproteobacteria bacterium]